MGAVKTYIVVLSTKIFERKFQKPLDKPPKVWYNIYTRERRTKVYD